MISVCIATYNGAKYIKEQIDSILNQLELTDEIIISDDGSTDNTIEILKSYQDTRIKIFNNVDCKGVIGNFENALKQAKGDYIFLSDQDDLWHDDKVKICIGELQKIDLVMHDAIVWDGEKILSESFFKLRGSKTGYINNIIKNSYMGCCMAFRKEVLSKILPIPKNITMHDTFIGLVCDRYFKVRFIHHGLLYYRRHDNNVSSISKDSANSVFIMLRNRIKIFTLTMLR